MHPRTSVRRYGCELKKENDIRMYETNQDTHHDSQLENTYILRDWSFIFSCTLDDGENLRPTCLFCVWLKTSKRRFHNSQSIS